MGKKVHEHIISSWRQYFRTEGKSSRISTCACLQQSVIMGITARIQPTVIAGTPDADCLATLKKGIQKGVHHARSSSHLVLSPCRTEVRPRHYLQDTCNRLYGAQCLEQIHRHAAGTLGTLGVLNPEHIMGAHLSVVADQPNRIPGKRHNGYALRCLAKRLTEQVRSGQTSFAHAMAESENLTPIEISLIATWMTKDGVSETDILAVMAATPKSFATPTPKL